MDWRDWVASGWWRGGVKGMRKGRMGFIQRCFFWEVGRCIFGTVENEVMLLDGGDAVVAVSAIVCHPSLSSYHTY